jgi:hypothetical protein
VVVVVVVSVLELSVVVVVVVSVLELGVVVVVVVVVPAVVVVVSSSLGSISFFSRSLWREVSLRSRASKKGNVYEVRHNI